MPENTTHDFYPNVRNFEATCETQIRQTLLQLQQSKTALQKQAGIAENTESHFALLNTALRHILEAETVEQVQAYQKNFNYLLDTSHPETTVLPLNQYLETLLELAEHYEQLFEQEKDEAKLIAALAMLRKKVKDEERQFAARAAILLDEFSRAAQPSNKNYDLAIQKIKKLQTHMADAHRLVTEILPQSQNKEHLQHLRQELRHMTDIAHHAATVDNQTSELFLNTKNKSKKLAATLCDVRTAYLQTKAEKSTEAKLETVLEVSWQALQAVGGFVPVTGALQYAAPALASLDAAKNVAETREKKSSSWWQRFGTVLATAAAVIGVVAFFAIPPLAIPAAIIAGVSIAYAVSKGIKEYREQQTEKDHLFQKKLAQHAAAVDDHKRSKTTLRENQAKQQNQLSSEAKMEMLLRGHKSGDALSAQEKNELHNQYNQMLEQDKQAAELANKPATPAPQPAAKPKLDPANAFTAEPPEEEPRLGGG